MTGALREHVRACGDIVIRLASGDSTSAERSVAKCPPEMDGPQSRRATVKGAGAAVPVPETLTGLFREILAGHPEAWAPLCSGQAADARPRERRGVIDAMTRRVLRAAGIPARAVATAVSVRSMERSARSDGGHDVGGMYSIEADKRLGGYQGHRIIARGQRILQRPPRQGRARDSA